MDELRRAPAPRPESGQSGAKDGLAELQRGFPDLQVRQTEIDSESERLVRANARLEESVARLTDLYDFAPVAYLTLAPDCRILDANLTAASFFERERGALIGSFLSGLVLPAERKILRAHVEACLSGHTRVDSELSFTRRGRPPTTAQVSSVAIRDSAGASVRCKTVLLDSSALKWERDKLLFTNEASGLLASSFDVTANLIQIARLAVMTVADICIVDLVDEDRTLRRVEVAFGTGVMSPRTDLLAEAHPRVLEGMALARVLRTREPLLFETVPGRGSRSSPAVAHDPLVTASAPTSLMYIPIVGRGEVLGVLTFIAVRSGRAYNAIDVATTGELAAHVAMAMENARLYEEAQRAIAARQDVLSFVSHDLKNPLMGIMLTAETILRGAPGDDRRSAAQLRRIQHAAQQMRRMIDDLLDMTALDAGRLAVQIDSHDVGPLLQAAADQFGPLAAARGIELGVAPPKETLTVACDRQRLTQVFSHLVDNALKFTPEGGRISISARASGQDVVFAVADTGPGIAAELRPLIFERFAQAPGHAMLGRGLGLYIAKGLVAAQAGSIWVESQAGSGATFSFTLPRALSPVADRRGPMPRAGAALRANPPVERK
jgi:signal transduction histidine kinase/PAS domain-containing protein